MTKTAFLFPGQGAQAVGMGRRVFETVPEARACFNRASELLGYDLAQICLEGPKEKLDSTVISQPALFVSSMAALEQLKQQSPETIDQCSAAAGLSLGEYTAFVFADAINFDAGLRLVAERGRAMQDAADAVSSGSGMVSVLGLECNAVGRLCDQAREDQVLQVANLLCPGNIVVSGHTEACMRLTRLAEKAGAMRVISLAVAGAFHTPLMQPAVERLQAALANVEIRPPRIPVVSNVDARPHDDPEKIRTLLLQQLICPVRWEDSIRWMIDGPINNGPGIGQFHEIGPGRILRGLLKRIARKMPCENTEA